MQRGGKELKKIAIVLILALALAGCGGEDTEQPTTGQYEGGQYETSE